MIDKVVQVEGASLRELLECGCAEYEKLAPILSFLLQIFLIWLALSCWSKGSAKMMPLAHPPSVRLVVESSTSLSFINTMLTMVSSYQASD